MQKYEVIIIGAGASGLMCALQTTKPTLLLEAGDRVGKKILATGNGKCNLTNNQVSAQCYNTPLVTRYLARFNQEQTKQYFNDLGLFIYVDEAGRCYPLSNSANSVLDLLLRALSLKSNVQVVTNALPQNITQAADGFVVSTAQQSYACRKLVLATGGNSGTQYLNQLQVKYQNFVPSLMGLKTTKNKGLAGVRVSNVRVKFADFDEVGEVLFKDGGISGIVIFNLSAYLARRKIQTGKIALDLLAGVSTSQLQTMVQHSLQHNPRYSVPEILTGFLHKSLARNLAERLGLAQKLAGELNATHMDKLVELIKNYTVSFTGYADNNQVYTGGVDLADLDENLQHKTVCGLYLTGELVNVDGVCGGYNLQWAWTSGKIVGENL
ncbi:MAG: aminoacetone oxidase family FAD-binding enzyme [Eubacteriales bacterium]|nr:aminoacetone oxidase family FAD-binding enzyme [Eubacteriales bacterium]